MKRAYRIWCTVSGGVTGSRSGWLKVDGEVVKFRTRAEAEEEARRLDERMNRPESAARFNYTVETAGPRCEMSGKPVRREDRTSELPDVATCPSCGQQVQLRHCAEPLGCFAVHDVDEPHVIAGQRR